MTVTISSSSPKKKTRFQTFNGAPSSNPPHLLIQTLCKQDPGKRLGFYSGATAVVALIQNGNLIVANAGDSRCVLSENGIAVDLSEDHSPDLPREKERILKAGGFPFSFFPPPPPLPFLSLADSFLFLLLLSSGYISEGRVNGNLNLSRAIGVFPTPYSLLPPCLSLRSLYQLFFVSPSLQFNLGDLQFKENLNIPPEAQIISAQPEIKIKKLEKNHEFMVLACDGIWNRMGSQDVIDFVKLRLEQESLESICEQMLDYCLADNAFEQEGVGADNMTVIIVLFNVPSKEGQSEPAVASSTKSFAKGEKEVQSGS